MGRPKGTPRTGGRKPGTPNRRTLLFSQAMEELGCDQRAVLAAIANGELPCGTCHGSGKTKFQSGNEDGSERKCQSCWGSGKEKITTGDRLKAAAELMKYEYPQRKAIEHTGAVASLDFNALTPEERAKLEKAEAVLGDLLNK